MRIETSIFRYWFLISILLAFSFHASGDLAIRDQLMKLGVSPDHPSLIRALHDPRPLVRSLVAQVLAYDPAAETIPPLLEALKAEQDSDVAFQMTVSLNMLGASEGTRGLEKYCEELSSTQAESEQAAYALLYGHHYEKCWPRISHELTSSSAGERESALFYLSLVPSADAQAVDRLVPVGPTLLGIATGDPSDHLREMARKVIQNIGDPETRKRYADIAKSNPAK